MAADAAEDNKADNPMEDQLTAGTKIRRALSMSLLLGGLTLALIPVAGIGGSAEGQAAPQSQQTFSSPEAGVAALVDALRKDDRQALESVLGPGSSAIVESGDPVADKNAKDTFLKDYDAKSTLVPVSITTRVLQVGRSDWTLPIPLTRRGAAWSFDLDAGRDEMLSRRIGRNEENTIQAALAFVDAERDYASADRDGDGILEYAQLFASTPGMVDGLYWPVQPGEAQSPLGPFFAAAQAQGYFRSPVVPGGTPTPYYGYYYNILTAQGPAASGGAYDYMVDGKMIGGVALIAYPAEYGVSGVMTFIVNHDGIVYQQDLGPDTSDIAPSITEFDPDDGWQRVANFRWSGRRAVIAMQS